MRKKILFFIAFLFLAFAMLKSFHAPILRYAGSLLIYEDSLQSADLMVVLSGNAFERGNAGAQIYAQGFAPKIICPGGNIDLNALIIYGDSVYESDLSRMKIIQKGIPDSVIITLHQGTSTLEEAEEVLQYCKRNDVNSIIIVSSYFHTARAKRVYEKVFAHSGIKIIVRGVSDYHFDEKEWWKSEEGLISFNNSVLKTFYYFLKH